MDTTSVVLIFGSLSAAVTFIVTWVKSLLLQVPPYAELLPKTQAILLQGIAFVAGVVIAISTQANILATFPQFATLSPLLSQILTGLACSGGSLLFYSVLVFLSGKVVLPAPGEAQVVEGKAVKVRVEYLPFS